MQREIKFRFWCIASKEWWYLYDEGPVGDSIHGVGLELGSEELNEEFITCEYTGLKDKNGKEIYEGDIVSHLNYYNRVCEYDPNYARYVLTSYNSSKYKITDHQKYDLEVIGNIYENPELLTEELTK